MEKKILNAYYNLINEYLSLINQSTIIKNANNHNFLTYIGLNSIFYIFKIILINTNDLEKALLNSQKGYFFYLEYIEQIKNSNILHHLNNIDAIKFIYNKTMNHIFKPELKNDDVKDSVVVEEFKVLPKIIDFSEYKNYEKRINILLNWENHDFLLENRIEISKKFLLNYLSIENDYSYLFDYLEIIIEKTKMDYENYCKFLDEFYKSISKLIKQKKMPNKSDLETICMSKYYLNNDKPEEIVMSKFVKSLFIV